MEESGRGENQRNGSITEIWLDAASVEMEGGHKPRKVGPSGAGPGKGRNSPLEPQEGNT